MVQATPMPSLILDIQHRESFGRVSRSLTTAGVRAGFQCRYLSCRLICPMISLLPVLIIWLSPHHWARVMRCALLISQMRWRPLPSVHWLRCGLMIIMMARQHPLLITSISWVGYDANSRKRPLLATMASNRTHLLSVRILWRR